MPVSPIASVHKALAVLQEIGVRQPIGVSEIARELNLTKSAAQRVVVTLHQAGWIAPSGEEVTRWTLTSKALVVGSHFTPSDMRQVALPLLHALTSETGETSFLGVLDGLDVVFVDSAESSLPLKVSISIGSSVRAVDSASAAAIASGLDASGLAEQFGALVADPDFRQRMGYAVRHGFAINLGRDVPGFHTVAAPLRNATGYPVAAIGLCAPATRMRPRKAVQVGHRLADLVAGVVAPSP